MTQPDVPEVPSAVTRANTCAPTVAPSVARDRTRQCMKELCTGNVHVMPVLIVSLYTYISGTREECPRRDARACISRGIDVLNDLMDMMRDGSPELDPAPPSDTPVIDLFSHICICGVGALTRYEYVRPAAGWCAACFFLLRTHEAMGAMGRTLVSTERLATLLGTWKWILSVLFFCLDMPANVSVPTRFFAHFATGILGYRVLFRPQTRVDKCVDVALCAADAAGEGLLTYCVLAFRVLHSDEVI